MDMTDPAFDRPVEPAAPLPPRRRRGLFILPLLAFLVGLAVMAWVLTRWEAAASYLGVRPTLVQAPPAQAPAATAPVSAPTEVLAVDPAVAARVATLEQRVAEIANQSQAAVGNADRAEGLLVAFAARRALDRGVALGYLEGLLRQRFGETQPQAVGTIITAAHDPITLQELQDGLQQVGTSLVGGGPQRNWWTALKAELGGLITVRKSGSPSTLPAERLARAKQRLEAGQVDVALAEVLRMPGRDSAADWISDARRYVAARRALDMIETAALLEPRAGTTPAPAPTAVPPATDPSLRPAN